MSERDRFRVSTLSIDGAFVIKPDVRTDDRGFFLRTFDEATFADLGLGRLRWLQENQSRSRRGTLRGLHFRSDEAETKLVRCARGTVFEAIVDLRPQSPSYRQVATLLLDDVDCCMVVVPVGCAHGFQVLTDVVDIVYRHSAVYDPASERAVRFDDPAFAIAWPEEDPVLSERDRHASTFDEIEAHLGEWFPSVG